MEETAIREATERIIQMEKCFDILKEAANENPSAIKENAMLKELFQRLIKYYEGGMWLKDYELDEKGLISKELKRAVLSQDAVYNFLEEIKEKEK